MKFDLSDIENISAEAARRKNLILATSLFLTTLNLHISHTAGVQEGSILDLYLFLLKASVFSQHHHLQTVPKMTPLAFLSTGT